ncbi:MAG TPA: imidazole glycerol phosphate synthase subunit HisH [Acidobacteriaceae bacterium]|nr:imidazole glycerol phosphate synthase subunit HisH [Acidobacteriaceae bacterium]
MIAVIDYKAGNLTSVMKALDALGCQATVTADPDVVGNAKKVILPGVGHFQATQLLADTGLTAAVRDSIERGIPFLGICVGLQWLFEGSTEAPATKGLGLFTGQCERFTPAVKVPHVGWNQVRIESGSRLMQGVENCAFVYYTHAYRAPLISDTVAVTEYDGPFSGAVERDNVMGVQFHPEKSGSAGMRVLRNFVELPC